METGIYRLKEGRDIIGFLSVKGKTHYFSKDGYHWSGQKINYQYRERYTGFRDRNDKRIFENDIVISKKYPNDQFILHYDFVLTKFLLVSYKNKSTFNCSLTEFFNDKSSVSRLGFFLQ